MLDNPPFELLETLALDQGQWRHGALHLERLRQAAAHFGFAYHRPAIDEALQNLAQQHPQGLWRTRVLLDPQGCIQASAFPMTGPAPEAVRLQLAARTFEHAHSPFTRFKTTQRAHYDAMAPTQPEVFDTVLWNADGEITECTRGNVAMKLDGEWVTPPVRCGLLNGIGRAVHLQNATLREEVVTLQDLPRVQGWAFINSLRGWIPAQLSTPSD